MYNIENYKFGKVLKKERKAKKMSIKELAERMGKAATTIYKYEDGTIIVDIQTALEICNILDVKIEKFIDEVE